MDIKKAVNDFYDELNLIVVEHDFNVSKSKQYAIKKTSIGFCKIYFDTDKLYDFTYSINLKFKIRCDKIQEVRGKIDTAYSDIDDATILSTPFMLLDIMNKPELDFEKNGGNTIDFDNTVSKDKWLLEFKKFMTEIGFPFFEQFKNIEDFHEWFNKPVSESKYGYQIIVNWSNFVCGLIVAKLVKSVDYENIYTVRMADLTRVGNKKGIKELQKTKLYLDEHY